MNKASIIGILLGFTAIIGGSIVEGGRIGSIVQGSAALIVFGGTLGATFLSFSIRDISLATRSLREVFFENPMMPEGYSVIKETINLSARARKSGILSLDKDIQNMGYDFFRRALRLVIDGIDPKLLRSTLEQEISTFEEERGRAAKVFESAGGFAPTIGIIGAVLGLIHVMENLGDPAKLGTGIAVAFVATVYGVGSANLLFLPIAKKIINNMKHEVLLREIIIEGVLGVQAGRNPFYLREYLNSFLSKRK
ncbi:MAG: flagellar motor protein [Nitrospirae bacterium]|nr:flagellar motor protein [Nitrospirota bacterium]